MESAAENGVPKTAKQLEAEGTSRWLIVSKKGCKTRQISSQTGQTRR
jgi:hypothetical protein